MHEINLLPPSRRSRMRQQWLHSSLFQFVRHVQISLAIVTAAGLLCGASLYGISRLSPNTGNAQLLPLVRQYQAIRQTVGQENALAQAVADLGNNRIVWSDHLADLLGTMPVGTTITQIQATSEPARLVFSGTAANRNVLIILESRLKNLPWAQNVTSPLQNLLARDNPQYSFTIDINPSPSPIPAVDNSGSSGI